MATAPAAARPHRMTSEPPALKLALNELCQQLLTAYPDLPNPRWVAMRLLGGDDQIAEALRSGELAGLSRPVSAQPA